ncbi:hypothetical protein ACGE0T_12165 [Parabacteroides sp. APC149_11_2_Y6]
MKTELQDLCPSIRLVQALAASIYLLAAVLLASCTAEADKTDRTSTGGTDSANKREVLLSFKNKLTVKTTKTETKADVPIATEMENEIATLDIYVFGAKTEGDAYTFRERFAYRQDGSALPAGAKELNLTPSTDNATTTALLELQKGLFVRLYCIANQTDLINPVDGNIVADTYFAPLTYDMETGLLTDGIPTELQFQKYHSPLLANASPALGLPLPMTGAQTTPIDLTDFASSARVQVGFKLTRTMARFDVSNIEEGSKFHLESISMGNGRRGTTFFPVKVYGAATAADGELITYPASAFEGENANKGLQVSAFYSYPSLLEDEGFLILNGTYQVNLTEKKEVTYQIPFKQQTSDGGSVELEINPNHRYTIGITKADEYHLDFTLDVADWDDAGNVDDYNPSGNGNALALSVIIPDDMKDRVDYTEETSTVAIEAQGGFSFDVLVSNNMPLDVTKNYTGSAAAQDCDWLEISAPTEITKASAGGYRYTISVKSGYDKEIYPKAVFRFTDRITGDESILRVTQAPPISVIIPEDMNGKVLYTETSRTVGIEATDNYRFNVLINSKAPLTMSKEYAGGSEMQLYDWLDVNELPELTRATVEGKSYAVSVKPGYDKDLCPDAIVHFTDTESGFDNVLYVKPLPAMPVLSSAATVALHAEANYSVPSFTITGKSVGGSKISGPDWLTYETTNSSTNLFSYTVKLDPSKSSFPTAVPGEQTIRIINSGDETKVVEVKVSFTEANAWIASNLANYDQYTSDGYRVGTGGKTMTVSFYSMFAAPALSTSYDSNYCSSKNGGNTWLNSSKLAKTEIVNNRRKYTYNIVVTGSSGTDAAYQLHRAVMNIKQNSTTIKSYTLWRGASYIRYPAGGGSPYYTAIRKGSYYWAPVNCGATRVAQAGDGKSPGTVAGTGNLYQWGRYDYTNHGGSTASGPISNSRPNNNTFYKAPNNTNDWLTPQNNTLWNGSSKGVNDPCPPGYRVPTFDELWSIGNATSYDNSGGLFKVNAESGYPQLVLPAAGYRYFDSGASVDQGSYGFYWSSSVPSGSTGASRVHFNSATLNQKTSLRASCFSVRCLKE